MPATLSLLPIQSWALAQCTWKTFGNANGFEPFGPEPVKERATLWASCAPLSKMTMVL